jgi:hypothetical protein
VLSPWHSSGARIQVTLTPGGNPGDEFGGVLGSTDNQIWENGPRPGRAPVSAMEEKNYDRSTYFDLISVSPVKKITFKEPTCLSTRTTGQTSSSLTPIHFALHPTAVNHSTYHHRKSNLYQAFTQIRPSNTVLTKVSKLRSPADFSKSVLHRAPRSGRRSGPAIAKAAIRATDDRRTLNGT